MKGLKILLIIIFLHLGTNAYVISQLTDKWKFYDAKTVIFDDPIALDPTSRYVSVYDSNHYVALQYKIQWDGEFWFDTEWRINVGYRGIVITDDGGLNWKQIYQEKLKSIEAPDRENHNRSIAYPSLNTIIVVGDSSEFIKSNHEKFKSYCKILITHDLGKNWEKIILDSNTQGKDIIMLDEMKGILLLQIIGNDNNNIPRSFKLLYTEDCWKTFKEIYQSDSSKIFFGRINDIRLAFPNQNKIAIINDNKEILLSEDLGANWHSVSMPGYNIKNITFLDEKIGYMQAHDTSVHFQNQQYEKLFKTTDGGYTWTMIFDDIEGRNNFRNYSIYDENNYMLIGSFENKSTYKRTTDGGKTWELGYLGTFELAHYINPVYIIQFGTNYIQKYTGDKRLIPPYTAEFIKKDSNIRYDVSNTIRWNKVEGATKYRVNVWGRFNLENLGMGSLYGSVFINYQRKHNALSVITRDTSVDVQLWYSGIYTFSVTAMNDLANSSMNTTYNGPPSCKTVMGNLERPIIYSPHVGHPYVLDIQDSLQLRWSKVEGATTYDLFFTNEDAYISLMPFDNMSILILVDYPDTSYTVDALEPDTDYRLYVAAASHNDHSTFNLDIFKTSKILSVKNIVQGGDNLIYPNPVRDKAGLRVYINKPVQAEIKLSDYNGNMRSLWQGILNEGKNEIELDVADVPRGFYNIILDYGRGNYVFKFIKE